MSSWHINWLNTDNDPSKKYTCKTHGDIGRDIIRLEARGSVLASNLLCHRCFVSFLNQKFSAKERP
jgi:hypothetical protein